MSKFTFRSFVDIEGVAHVTIELSNDVSEMILEALNSGKFQEEMKKAFVDRNPTTMIQFETTKEKADFLIDSVVKASFEVLCGENVN